MLTDYLTALRTQTDIGGKYFSIEEYADKLIIDGNKLPKEELVNLLWQGMKNSNYELPPIKTEMENLIRTTKEFVKSGFELVSKEVESERYELCKSCSFFKNYRCLMCGCYMKYKVKVKIAECSKGFW